MTTFAQQLRQLRCGRHLTQVELAKAIGVSTTYISAMEGGRKPAPPREVVRALEKALSAEPDLLWAPARRERERRLMARLQGRPTSSAPPPRAKKGGAESPRPRTAEEALADAVLLLRDAAETPAKKKALAEELKRLTQRLLSSSDKEPSSDD